MKKKGTGSPLQALSFDEALLRLEALVEEMERGNFSLEEAMKKYAEGSELAEFCQKQLQASEKAVNKVLVEADGKVRELDLNLSEEQ